MGCVVSHKQTSHVNLVTTPRDKLIKPDDRPHSERLSKDRIFASSSTIKEEEEEIGSLTEDNAGNFTSATQKTFSNPHRHDARREADNVESHIKEQYIFYRMDSVTTRRKSHSETSGGIFQRASSIRGMKEPLFNEFSFKQSMDSSCEKDGDALNSPRSSRQNMGNASNHSGESVHKFEGLGFGGGLKRTATPNFSKSKPSGFLLEKRYSMKNLKVNAESFQQISSVTSIIPHDLKDQTPHDLGFTFNSLNKTKSGNPSIEDNYLYSGGLEIETKKLSRNTSKDNNNTTTNISLAGTLKLEEIRSPEHGNVSVKPIAKINMDTFEKIPKQNGLDQQIIQHMGQTSNFIAPVVEVNDNEKPIKKSSTLDNQSNKPKIKTFEQRSAKILTRNASEKDNENNKNTFKEAEQSVSTTNTNANNTTATSAEILGNTKDMSIASKYGNLDQNSIKSHVPFIKRVDSTKSGRSTAIFATEHSNGVSAGSIKDSPIKDVNQMQDVSSNILKEKSGFQKKLFPSQLSIHAKFTVNLLDLLKEQADDLSPVLPISHSGKSRQQSQKAKNELSGGKNTFQSIDYGNSQSSLPINLLTITRQETLQDSMLPKNPVLYQGKFARKGTHETLPGGTSPIIQHNKFNEQDSNLISLNNKGGFSGHPQQTMRTDNSTIYDNRTIYNPEDNISAINLTKYVFNYDNEDVEFDEAAGTGVNRPNILNGLLNQDEYQASFQRESTSMPPIRLDSSVGLNRRDSLASIGKESNSRKGFQLNDGFGSHVQQFEDASAIGSKPSSKNSIGSMNNIPKPELKQNPYRSIRDSVFRTSPRDQQALLAGQSNINQPQADTPGGKSLYKAKSCIIAAEANKNKDNEEIMTEEPFQPRTTSKIDTGTNQIGQENLVANRRMDQLRKDRNTPTFSKSQDPGTNQKYQPSVKNLEKDTTSNQNKGYNLKRRNTAVLETSKLEKSKDSEGQTRINNYVFIKDLGRGSFGKVKLAQDKFTSHYFAVKVVDKEKLKRKMLGRSKDAPSTLASEIAIMKKLDHPNVVKLWEVIDDPDPDQHKLYLVMDYIKKGAVMSENYWRNEDREASERNENSGLPSTNNIINEPVKKNVEDEQKRVLSEEKCLRYFRQLILGLDYLHNYAHVIHRDIKPENLLIDHEDNLKISDFGVSYIMENENNDDLKSNAGTKYFLPPEAFKGKGFHGKPADIWAAGATLYYFLTCKPPFEASNQQELKQKIINETPVYPAGMNPKIKQMIESCLKKDPDQRATLKQIMTSDWLTEDGMYVVENRYEPEDEFKVSAQDISGAVSTLRFRATILVTAKMKKTLNKTREKIERKKTLMADSKNNPLPNIQPIQEDSSPQQQQ